MNKPLRWIGLCALALGGTNAVILIMDTLITNQGSIAAPLLALGFILSAVAMPGYAELVLMYPEKTGGIAAVCTDAFRPYNTILSNIAGTCYWFAWTPLISFTAIFMASFIQLYFFPSISIPIVSTCIIIAITLLALGGVSTMQRIAIPIAALTALLILLAVFIPILSGNVDWKQATYYDIKSVFGGYFGEFTSIMSGLYLIGWIAPSMETLFCYVGETEKPEKNVPKAMYIVMGCSLIFFLIIPTLWLGVFGENLKHNILNYALLYQPLGIIAGTLGTAFLVFNMVLALISGIMGAPRTIAQLSQDGLVPKFFELKNKKNAPWVGTLITAGLAIIIIWFNSPLWLIAASNFGYLIAISFASIAVWLLRKQAPQAKRSYKAPKGFIKLGLFSALIWMLTLVFGFQQYGISIMVIGIGFSFLGGLLFIARYLTERYKQGLSIVPKSLHLKLTSAILGMLIINACVFFLAIGMIDPSNLVLLTLLKDMFIFISLLNLLIGIVIPSMIIYAINEINRAAKRLLKGPLNDFSNSLQQIGSGNLEASQMKAIVSLILIYSQDEIGEMATNFNQMQIAIKKAADNIDNVRRSLITEKRRLIESNLTTNATNTQLENKIRELKMELTEAYKKIEELSSKGAKSTDSDQI